MDFSARLGPLPVWAWGAIGGVVLAAGSWVVSARRRASAPTNLDANGYQTSGINGGSAKIDSTPNIDNNVLWLSRAAKSTAASLSASPSTVYAALQKWLQGQPLTSTEQGIVDAAIKGNGTPPEGVQGISAIAPPALPPLAQTKPGLFYVAANRAWGLIFPGGNQATTTDQATANAWAAKYGNAATVTPEQYNTSFADSSKVVTNG